MIYPSNYEDKIGFASIRNILSEICLCTLGQQKIAEMKFSTNHKYIVYRMKQTMEFVRILDSEDFPEHNFIDMRAPLKRINIENTFLEVNELSDLQKSLSSIGMMISYLNRIEEKTETYKYPTLQTLTENTHQFQHIIDAIGRILDKFGNIKDSASPDLARIRRELSYTAGSISRSLNSILRQAQNDGLIDKDLSPTIRDGRLVLPVSPSMKRRIKGIIHDESDTGKTVYIEPSEVVEANNKIRELEADERREIQRILLEITNKIRPEVHDIEQNFEFLAEIDFTRAKAKFAINTKSIQPEISTKPEIDWSIAIHPLLEKSLKKNGKSVVPLDIKLSSKNRILLISGPNAGGKSVCLKTVGLLQYMLQCGMPIPVAPSSTAGIFRSIFIDIGDEQSLEDDLSTYSSHLLNMKNMMKGCDGNSLILIDEFGGGTEPQIGGAIAEAILKRFNTTGSYGIITTHYQNLKEYAQNTPGIINGAMLYDRQNMQPLFQLRIGNPGSSFAIEIARKTGIPEEVIADATEIVGKDYISADKYLQDILRDKKYWEKKRESVHKQEKIMNQIISQHETEIQTLHEERKKILTKAKEEAQQLIKDSNAKIERTIKEIKEAQAEKESTKFIRQSLNEFKESIESQNDAEMENKIQRQMNKILARKERIRNKNKQEKTVHQTDKGETPAKSIAKHTHPEISFVAGDYVRIKGQNTVGQIKQINNKQAQVTFGMIITNIKISQLEHAEKPETQKRTSTFVTKVTQDDIRERKLNFKQDIDVRGMRADEAIQAITYFIDDAIVANVSPVRILHGTGSGILRTILRQHLSTISGVKSFRDEHVDFGGAGITIVNLD